jgi:hypothetical protein
LSEPLPPSPRVRPQDVLTPVMIMALRDTKPWVRFLSVMAYIGTALLGIGGVVMALFATYQLSANGSGGMTGVLGVFYAALAIPYWMAAQRLGRYADEIATAETTPSKEKPVERALRAQQSFWKFAGITVIVMLAVYVIAVPVAIVVAISSARTGADGSSTSTRRPLFPSTLDKQKQTMLDMMKIARAMEARATDVNSYPFGNGPVSKFVPLLEPTYIKSLPLEDAWGNPFIYESGRCSEHGCGEYYIASGGTDDTLLRQPHEYAGMSPATTSPEDDIVFANGTFIRYPAAVDPAAVNSSQN